MTAEVAQQVLSCEELSVGDGIEAWHNGRLVHRGEVIRTVAATDLFWILDGRTGVRRLIDAGTLVIRRAAVPAANPDPAAPEAAVPAVPSTPAVPASYAPLFQALSPVP